jgi:hypothetical protein
VLAALIIGVIGFFSSGTRGAILLVCAAVLGSLAGLEVAIREHFAGFKSHTTVLSLAIAVAAMALAFFAGGPRWLVLAVGIPLFVFAFSSSATRSRAAPAGTRCDDRPVDRGVRGGATDPRCRQGPGCGWLSWKQATSYWETAGVPSLFA